MKKQRMNIDRLSSLPDHILLHILSHVGGDVKEVSTTSVLSKRWQFLWVQLPALTFSNQGRDVEKTPDFVSWLNRTLILRNKFSINLEEFKVSFMTYDESYYPDVNVWVRFAVRNNVKKLSLILSSEYFYTLPQVLYSHSTLTSLCLSHCVVAPQLTIEWPCLTELTIEFVELPENLIGEIQSGCPVLYKLALVGCKGFERLHLDSPRLQELEFYDGDEESQSSLEISGPFLRSLTVRFSPLRLVMRLVDVHSLVAAYICYTVFGFSDEEMETTSHLFEKTKHVKDFKVDSHVLHVVHNSVDEDGWRVSKASWRSLRVDNAWRDEYVLEGILFLLESAPNIETLLIECLDPYEAKGKKGGSRAKRWGTVAKDDMDSDLPHLKTVTLLDFADPRFAWEPMLTLARILLKRATSLEKMVISAKGKLEKLRARFDRMSETVQSYPRSSETAIVVVHK